MAVRDMDVAAEVISIRLMRAKLLAFAMSSFYCGVTGALFTYAYLVMVERQNRIAPESTMIALGGDK
jgi:branched-chain amino acid transport system permease protein